MQQNIVQAKCKEQGYTRVSKCSDTGVDQAIIGRGRNGAIRYRWADVEAWLASRPQVE